jgi:hypothetical protein
VQGRCIVVSALLLLFLQPAHANGGHIHVEGIFFLLLGGLVFIGGLCVVVYFLLRPGPEEAPAGNDQDDPNTRAPS